MSLQSYFAKYVISDIRCAEIHSINAGLKQRIEKLEGEKVKLEEERVKLDEENITLRYKLEGMLVSQAEIYGNYTEMILKYTRL